MTDNELVYISAILQLMDEGGAKLNDLAPAVRRFLIGMQVEYNDTDNEEVKHQLYYAINTYLGNDSNTLH